MLSNAYFLAKFRFDTAENEPAKDLQNFTNFANFQLRYGESPVHSPPDGFLLAAFSSAREEASRELPGREAETCDASTASTLRGPSEDDVAP